jgi:hypothetical protein
MQTEEMALKGIVLRKTKHRQILSIDLPTLTTYLKDLPTDSKGRNLFEVTENPNKDQHENISHFLTPLSPGIDRQTKVDGPTHFKS